MLPIPEYKGQNNTYIKKWYAEPLLGDKRSREKKKCGKQKIEFDLICFQLLYVFGGNQPRIVSYTKFELQILSFSSPVSYDNDVTTYRKKNRTKRQYLVQVEPGELLEDLMY